MAVRTAYRQPQAGGIGPARNKKVLGGATITLVAADVALNAQTALLRVPKGFVLQSHSTVFGDCDTGATLACKLGDAGDDDRIMAAATTGQAGGTNTTLAAAGLNYEFPEDTDILLTASVAAAGLGPTPTVACTLEGYIR